MYHILICGRRYTWHLEGQDGFLGWHSLSAPGYVMRTAAFAPTPVLPVPVSALGGLRRRTPVAGTDHARPLQQLAQKSPCRSCNRFVVTEAIRLNIGFVDHDLEGMLGSELLVKLD